MTEAPPNLGLVTHITFMTQSRRLNAKHRSVLEQCVSKLPNAILGKTSEIGGNRLDALPEVEVTVGERIKTY
jgi:hypothetical protein